MGENKSGLAGTIPKQTLSNGDIEAFERGKDELNLAEFPIAVVAESARPGQLTLVFSDTIQDRSTGKTVERSVTVHGTQEWGLPAAQDDDVMIALMQLSFLHGWTKRTRFTRYQLCQLLRWSVGGASYRRIYRALHRLSTTTYNYRFAWRDKANQRWIPSQVFSYIQALRIHEADSPTESGLCEVTWSDDFHRSLKAGSLKGIDFNLFVTLKSPIAKRLYRFLDKRFGAGRTRYSCDLKVLAFEKVGVSRSYRDAAQIKRLLTPAIRELEGAGFLAQASSKERFEKLCRGRWLAHFSPARAEQNLSSTKVELTPIETKLIDLGIVASEARKFVLAHPASYLEDKIDQFAFRIANKNPAGLLADSIRRDLPPPADYLPPKERSDLAKIEKRRRDKLARIEKQKLARLKEKEALEDRRFTEAERMLQALPEEERSRLERKADYLFPNAGPDIQRFTVISLLKNLIAQS